MKSIVRGLAGAGALVVAATVAASAQTPNHFRGSACVITVSPGCAAVGLTPGGCASARFRPPNYNGNGNSTRLSLFYPYYAQNFVLPTGSLLGVNFQSVNIAQIGTSSTLYTGTARIPAQTPTGVIDTTVFITSTIDINGFDSDAPTCNVRLRFTGQRYPQ